MADDEPIVLPTLIDVHRLGGIHQLLADSAFDESGHLANDDARYLLDLVRTLWTENQAFRDKLMAVNRLREHYIGHGNRDQWLREIGDILTGPKPSVVTDTVTP